MRLFSRPGGAVVVLGAALALTAIAGAVLLQARSEGSTAGRYRGSEPPPNHLVPEFALRDHSGGLLRTEDLSGKAVAITFLDTQCTEACPVIAGHVRTALELLPAEQRAEVAVVAITADPKGDTPSSVNAFLDRHRVQGKMTYLVGPRDALPPVWKGFGVLAETGNSNLHSAPVRIYDREGEWVSTLHAGVDLTAENLAHDLSAAL